MFFLSLMFLPSEKARINFETVVLRSKTNDSINYCRKTMGKPPRLFLSRECTKTNVATNKSVEVLWPIKISNSWKNIKTCLHNSINSFHVFFRLILIDNKCVRKKKPNKTESCWLHFSLVKEEHHTIQMFLKE